MSSGLSCRHTPTPTLFGSALYSVWISAYETTVLSYIVGVLHFRKDEARSQVSCVTWTWGRGCEPATLKRENQHASAVELFVELSCHLIVFSPHGILKPAIHPLPHFAW